MIFDCFLFFNELALLDIRLHELSSVVDKFVLVEATRTYSNLQKPLYYAENRDRYKKFQDRIIHVVVDDMPNGGDAWSREHHQRNAIMRGLAQCAPDDIVLISDVDEIPRAEKLSSIGDGQVVFRQSLYYYYINYACVNKPTWLGTRAVRRSEISTPQDIRMASGRLIDDGGWHFSYLGGVYAIRAKVQSFAHQEYNNPLYTDKYYIQHCISHGRDIFGRDYQWKVVRLDDTFPKHVRVSPRRFASLVFDSRQVRSVRKDNRVVPSEHFHNMIYEAQQQLNSLRLRVEEKDHLTQVLTLQAQSLAAEGAEMEQAVRALTAQDEGKIHQVQALKGQLADKEQALEALIAQVNEKDNALNKIYASRAWRLAQVYRKILTKLFQRKNVIERS